MENVDKIGETGKPEKSPKNRHILHQQYCPSPHDGIFALSWGWDLGNLMTSGAMLAVVYSTDRASHARQVLREGPDKDRYPGPPGWGLGHGVDNSFPVKFLLLRNCIRH